MKAFRPQRHNKLGDSLAILVGLENHGRQNGIESLVTGGPAFPDIFRCFSFDYVRLTDDEVECDPTDQLLQRSRLGVFWLQKFQQALAARDRLRYDHCDFRLPPCQIPNDDIRETVALIQFDASWAIPKNIEVTARSFTELPLAIVGGPATNHYLGRHWTDGSPIDYRLGSLDQVVRQIRRCQLFVGIDSGMAHVAGLLGVPSVVVNTYPLPFVTKYFSGYPGCRVVDRRHTPLQLSPIPRPAARAYLEGILHP